MAETDRISVMRTKIAAVLATKPQCFITHRAELAVLRQLDQERLREFAKENGWRVVWRIGGRQIEFYNDCTVRPGFTTTPSII